MDERFDLLDQSQVVTQPFTQDLVAYATPRPAAGGPIGATFPITPSRSYTIQELMLGVVKLDVTPFVEETGGSVIGAGGGTLTDPEGDRLEIPAGALGGNAAIALRRVTTDAIGITLPGGFDSLAAIQVDAVGVTLGQGALLSIAAPAGVTAQTQILIARAFSDPFGQRRLRLVAIGELQSGRVVDPRHIWHVHAAVGRRHWRRLCLPPRPAADRLLHGQRDPVGRRRSAWRARDDRHHRARRRHVRRRELSDSDARRGQRVRACRRFDVTRHRGCDLTRRLAGCNRHREPDACGCRADRHVGDARDG